MTRHEMFSALLENGTIKEFREWRHGAGYSDLDEAVKMYSEYVDEEIDNLSDDDTLSMINDYYYSGVEEFISDNPFIIEFIKYGTSPQIDNSKYIMRKDENDTYIDVSDLCEDCEEPHEWCICSELEDEDDEE